MKGNWLAVVSSASIPTIDSRREVGVGQPLFATRIPAVLAPFRTNYAESPDGQRLLVNSVTPEAAPTAITIAVNWQERWKK